MIYTVTLNPAIDYVISVDAPINISGINRNTAEEFQFGGKGVNVSMMLQTLGHRSVALGFVAGFTGDDLVTGLQQAGLQTDFVRLDHGITRINVKIKADTEMEINGIGPEILTQDIEALYSRIDKITDGDVLVLSGSVPKSLPEDTYEKMLARYQGRGIMSVVDSTGAYLINTLKYNPFLIKPNIHELEEIFGAKAQDDAEIIEWAKKLQEMGGRNILVSMAGEGALLLDENANIHRVHCPKAAVINSVGAGDSMVAGFIAGYLETRDYLQALRLSVLCGSATAFSKGMASKEQIFKLQNQGEI